jgi:hypothetical protein
MPGKVSGYALKKFEELSSYMGNRDEKYNLCQGPSVTVEKVYVFFSAFEGYFEI